MKKNYYCFVLLLLFVFDGNAQGTPDWKTKIEQLEKAFGIDIYYRNEWVDASKVTIPDTSLPRDQALQAFLAPLSLSYITYRKKLVVLLPDSTARKFASSSEDYGSQLKIPEGVTIIGDLKSFGTQRNATIRGRIIDANSGDPLIGANVMLVGTNRSTSTNEKGEYSFQVPVGLYDLLITTVGYIEERKPVAIVGDGQLSTELFDTTYELEEITIRERAFENNVTDAKMGINSIDVASIRRLPSFLGEADVIKSLTFLPGVSSVGEGSSGFNVRGGNFDQNLILMDGAPVFYPSHMLGFFSLINSEMVDNLTLYRGGVPAKYGGRISSVLDIRLKEGDKKRWNGNVGLGPITSKAFAEGPLIKNKASLALGVRVASADWILKRTRSIELRESGARYIDFQGTIDAFVTDKDKVRLSGYMSGDRFSFAQDAIYSYQNNIYSVSWTHSFPQNIYLKVNGASSDYDFEVENTETLREYIMQSGIHYKDVKADLTYDPGNGFQAEVGVLAGKYNIERGELEPTTISSLEAARSLQDMNGIEKAVYGSVEWKPASWLTLSAGSRYTTFDQKGPLKIYSYDPALARDDDAIIDSTSYAKGDVINTYSGFEPRGSASIKIAEEQSIKIGYNRMRQYINIVSNTAAVTPFDIWTTSSTHFKPVIGDQYGIGYFRNFTKNKLQTSVELFYKEVQNVTEYKNNADLFLKDNIETELLQGFGRSYGAEFLVQKDAGLLTGWVSYTYSRSLRTINGELEEQKINRGKEYAADFDKPHTLNIVSTYKLSRLWRFSGNFTYSTGRPTSYPIDKYVFNGIVVAQFSERNQFRVPDYHRLDIAFSVDGTNKRKAKVETSWTFSLYNVYGRKNAYSVFFSQRNSDPPVTPYKLAVLGIPFPSVTFNLKFL
ncbi:TonB-dependent receptor [uncultured Imperialibacter sp.]|uniref:TonB-dependent receptor n=1 Tax=uncultured Imperialibacter sp. TaxID=1672639 RepID=UPI0030DC31D9|tara:strand:+ start:9864 stop:12542 length:2679 start_codon:yes stop_codon:yes gene_type:complete